MRCVEPVGSHRRCQAAVAAIALETGGLCLSLATRSTSAESPASVSRTGRTHSERISERITTGLWSIADPTKPYRVCLEGPLESCLEYAYLNELRHVFLEPRVLGAGSVVCIGPPRMPKDFEFDVFLSYNSADKPGGAAEGCRAAGVVR
jgi:hypothetical protein